MSQDTIIFFLAAVIAVLSFVVLYQRFIFRKGIQKKIGDMGDTLEQILDEKSDEKVMVCLLYTSCRSDAWRGWFCFCCSRDFCICRSSQH